MVGHYGRRASYTASWNQRLYPRQEPTFDAPASAAATIERRERAGPTPPTCAPPATEPVAVPPPLYFPGEAQLARTRSQPTRAGHLSSINVARSQTATIPYRTHPTLRIGWRRLLRVGYYYRCLKSEREFFDDAWPSEFGGRRTPRTAGDEECDAEGGGRVSRSTSRRSGVSEPDSGVALTPRTTLDLERPQHPLEALFKARVAIINDKVALALVPTRVMLSILEIMDLSFVILLIIALGIERGRQRGFLQGVEVSLVLLILINGAMVNAVRMKRWALAKELRTLARDWSPLPITSSTNQGLLNNFLGEVDREALAERIRGKDQPSLRWSLRGTEGSWWLSYRPIMKVELVTPSGSAYGRLVPRIPVPQDDPEAAPEPVVPPYEE